MARSASRTRQGRSRSAGVQPVGKRRQGPTLTQRTIYWLTRVETVGLGMALPTGAVTLFEPTSAGELLVGEQRLRDYAEGQDIEIELGRSAQVFAQCAAPGEPGSFAGGLLWVPLKLILTNANPNPAKVRLDLGQSGQWRYRRISGVTIKDGRAIVEVTVPGNSRREFTWEARSSNAPG